MYYSFYQKKTFAYFFQKIKIGKFKKEKNDVQKRNLKGNIKTYQIFEKKDNTNVLIEKLEFNEDGYLIKQSLKDEYKTFDYYKNSKLSKCLTFSNENVLILTEFFKYDDKIEVLKSKRVFHEDYKRSNENYEEYYEYDLRNNITAKIKKYEGVEYINTFKYNENCNNTDVYSFENSFFGKRNSKKETNNYPLKIKSTESFMSNNDEIAGIREVFNENGDVIVKTLYNWLVRRPEGMSPYTTTQYFYKYDKFDNWISKTEYRRGNLIEEFEAQIEYY